MMFVLDQIARYFDPFAIAIVFGGTLLATFARSTNADLGRAWRSIGILRSADPEADALSARAAVGRISELVEVRSIMCADRVQTAQRFLHLAARRLSDSRGSTEFIRWATDEIDARRARHAGAIGVWRGIAETAPAMGMIGTIIGLVQMFAAMDDPAHMGPGMAVAMLTTLYGVILSAAIAGPIAGRLERLSETELDWQTATCKQFELLVRAELDHGGSRPKPNLRTVG
jgi:chemotaxis protein MotA